MPTRTSEQEGNIFSAGIWTVKPGREEGFLQRWKEFALWTMDNQKGPVSVVMVRDIEQQNVFISFCPWADLESIRIWRQTPAFSEAFRDFKNLCDKIEPHTLQRVWSLENKSR